MATILSANLLQFITPIIVFIFIFAIFFALLQKIPLFGQNKPLNSLIAFAVAILFLLIPEARQIIEVATPWFVVFVVAGLLLIMAFMILGIEESFIRDVAKDNAVVWGVVIGGIIFIFLFSITQVFGPSVFVANGTTDTSFFSTLKRTVFNPKILGLLIVLIITAEVVRRVGYSEKK